MHANCARVHPSFSLSRLTEQPPPGPPPPVAPLSPSPAPRRIVSPVARPLCSAPSLKVTDCLLYYPLVSIFTLLSEALSLPMSIVPAADSYHHNTVLKDLSARIIVAGVVGFCSHLTVYRDFEWSTIQCAESTGNGSTSVTRFIFVLR